MAVGVNLNEVQSLFIMWVGKVQEKCMRDKGAKAREGPSVSKPDVKLVSRALRGGSL